MKIRDEEYRKLQRNHLNLKFTLSKEISMGKYPDLTADLLYLKGCDDGHSIKSDSSCLNKIEALQVLRTMSRDYWEMFIIFDLLPKKYCEVLR